MTIIQDMQERWNRLNPFVADLLMAIGLTLVVWLQIWLFTALRPDFIRFPHPEPQPQDTSLAPYLIAAAAYLPLMLRRKVPWLAVLLTALAALLYSTSRMPTALTILGPMIALYSLASYTKERRTTLITLLVASSAIAIPAYVFSNIAQVVESTGLSSCSARRHCSRYGAIAARVHRGSRAARDRSRAYARRGGTPQGSTRSASASPAKCMTSSRTASRS